MAPSTTLSPQSGDEIFDLLLKGDCQQLRAHFDRAFWAGQPLAPDWYHLVVAVAREDKPMTRLLVTWGARPDVEDLARLKETAKDKYPHYIKLLRQCGLPLSPAVLADAEQCAAVISTDEPIITKKSVKRELEIGDEMPDGTIYAGISPDTGKPMYAAPQDASSLMDFNEAAKYAGDLKGGDKKDFRVPTKAELDVLFKNKEKGALKGTFNLTGSGNAGWYWSSTPYSLYRAWQQRFSDGRQNGYYRYNDVSVRCVR